MNMQSRLLAMFAAAFPEPQGEPLLIARHIEPSSNGQTPYKGKRSRRRRSAKMRAAGLMHLGGPGWIFRSEYAPYEKYRP